MKRLLSLMLCLLMVLSAAPVLASEPEGVAAEQVVRIVYSDEIETFNYLYQSSGSYYANYVEGLVECDRYGIVRPLIAESWDVSDDGLVYTFHLRDDAYWYTVDGARYAPVTANDFVFSAKYILTAENGSKTSDILMGFFKNATEYFEGACAWEDVGVKALDDHTLEYTLLQPCSYFMSNLSYVCFLPASEQYVTECGDKWAQDNTYFLYNSGYIMTGFQSQSFHSAIKNEDYWDADNFHITRIEKTYNAEADTLGMELVKRGEVTDADIAAEMVDSWMEDPELSERIRPQMPGTNSYNYWYLFNFWPTYDEGANETVDGVNYKVTDHETWAKVVNNLAFRKSFYHGLDRINALQTQDPYSPEAYVINTISSENFVSVGGKAYGDMGDLAKFSAEDYDSFDPDLALEYKAQAMEELSALGVTFPVVVYMPYNSGDTMLTNRAQVIQQQMESLLGTDYIKFIIEGYPNTDYLNSTRRAGNYMWMECYWGADFQDPATYCDPFRYGQKYNYMWYADGWAEPASEGEEDARLTFDGNWWKGYIYEAMYDEANAEAVDLAARYEKFANLEAWLIDTAIVTPYSSKVYGYIVSYFNPFEMNFDPFGISDDRYRNMWVYETPMGMDAFDEGLAAWEAERAAAIAAE